MPSSILNADIGFPAFTGTESTEDKVGQITNYLYMLLEQLKYSLSNIGVENINPGEMNRITEIVNSPINVQIGDLSGGLQNLNGTVSGINLRVNNAEGAITSLRTFNDGLTLSVQNGQESSTIELRSGSTTLASKTIRFLGDVLFASSLTDGVTTISGNNIKTGTIEGIDIRSGVFKALLNTRGGYSGEIQFWYSSYDGILAGGLRFDDMGAGTTTESSKRLILYTDWPSVVLKLKSAGNISIEAANGSAIYIGGDGQTVNINGTVKVNGRTL